ncbi:MAG TPA: hypothetical protein IGS40_26780 [Trichormus sp. M33_DOE_039]|nr:hypothetical protein [Trichormus sp. M33_DOE_039]
MYECREDKKVNLFSLGSPFALCRETRPLQWLTLFTFAFFMPNPHRPLSPATVYTQV